MTAFSSGISKGSVELEAGDVNIGNVDVVSVPAAVQAALDAIETAVEILDNAISGSEMQVDLVGALPTGTNALGSVTSKIDTDRIGSSATGGVYTPKFAVIDAATSGDNTLVAAVASKKIRVTSLYLLVSAAVTVRFESGAGGTALSGQMQYDAAGKGIVLGFNPIGWFETAVNTLLNLELSGAVSVDGGLTYVEAS